MRNRDHAILATLACLAIIPVLAGALALQAAPQQAAPQQATPPAQAETTDADGPAAPARDISAGYRLGPEDTVEVFVWQEDDISTTVMVRPDGMVSLPLVNELQASGRTAAELQREITEGLREYLDNPVVSVMVREINSARISVLGEVRDAGRFPLRQKANVLDAIAMAGGFTEFANRGNVVIVRGEERIRVDVNKVIGDYGAALFFLQPGDAVYVR